jgi:ABC-type lipoprotein release transport system permease subunit
VSLFGTFASIALALALIGLAASMNASVAETTHEIGTRSALGQNRISAAWHVRASLIRTTIGLATGMPIAIFLRRALEALWRGTPSPHVRDLMIECTSHLRYKTDQGPALHRTWNPYGS